MNPLTPWELEARNIVKVLMVRKDVNYKELAVKLAAIGIEQSNTNLSNKVQGGAFSLAFFLQLLAALEVRPEDLGNVLNLPKGD